MIPDKEQAISIKIFPKETILVLFIFRLDSMIYYYTIFDVHSLGTPLLKL